MITIPNNSTIIEPTHCITGNEKYIIDEFEKHFLHFAIWCRALIISLKYNLPNTEDVYNRLLEEPKHFELLMSNYLLQGDPERLKDYLAQFITAFRDIAIANLSNNNQQANKYFEELLQTTNKISEYFYNLNPSSSLDQWHKIFHGYVEMLYFEIYTIFSENHTGDIELFDKIMEQSYLIANHMSNTVLSILYPRSTTPQTGSSPPK